MNEFKIIYDVITEQTLYVDLTKEELDQRKIDKQNFELEQEKYQAETQSNANAKAIVLKKLGITESEARLLLA